MNAAKDFSKGVQAGDVVLLNGTLGAGKTVFARALVRALCGDEALEVASPTFTLVQVYDCAFGEVHHYDLYRLDDPEEILQIGWEDSLAEAITIVEWPERLGAYAPRDGREITITIGEKTGDRYIEIR